MKELFTGIVPLNSLVKIGNFQFCENEIKQFNGLTREECLLVAQTQLR